MECIEHWLWHIKDSLNFDGKEKGKSSDVEKASSSDAKKYVYRGTSVSSKQQEITDEITSGFSIDHLSSVSSSFSFFHQSIKNFIKQNSNQ